MESQVESYSIVPDGRTGAVLMLDTPAGWTLPGHPCAEAGEVNGEVQARFGLTVTVRTRVGEIMDGKRPIYLLAHENHSPGRAPHAGSWRDAEQVAASRLAEPAHREALDAWFGGLDGHRPAGAAWTRPGWFDEAAGWIAERAAEAGRTPAGPVRQVDCTPYSVTLRLPTSAGNVYLKAAPAEFGYEPRLVRLLADWFPDVLPPVLAVDRGRRWLLTAGVEPFRRLEGTVQDLSRHEEMVRRYATLQRDLVPHVEHLLALGVPDRRPEQLPAQLAQLLADRDALVFDDEAALTPEEFDRLGDALPAFAATCTRLAGYRVPPTLVNTDFWRDNVAVTDTGFAFLDWAESGICSPLQSLDTVLHDIEMRDPPDRSVLVARLRDEYLHTWTGVESLDRLRQGLALARPAATLCRALCWRDCLASLPQPRLYPYLRPAVALYLRRMLALVEGTA